MAADPAAIAAAAARALEAHQLRLEKHFGFRIDRLKADDEHGDYARWRAAILHHIRRMPGALEALIDAATVTAATHPHLQWARSRCLPRRSSCK